MLFYIILDLNMSIGSKCYVLGVGHVGERAPCRDSRPTNVSRETLLEFIFKRTLNSQFYKVAFRILDHTLIVPVSSGTRLPNDSDSISFHLGGQLIYIFL